MPALESRTQQIIDAALAHARASDDEFFRYAAATPPLDEPVEVSIMLCSDARMKALNAEWRGQDKTTDVLAFPVGVPGDDLDLPVMPYDNDVSDTYLMEDEDEDEDYSDEEEESVSSSTSSSTDNLLGDIVIALPTASRQADEAHHSLATEVELLLVHGILHLLGYDHEPPPDVNLEEMDSLESVEYLERAAAMASAERAVLTSLGWSGDGLLDRASTKATEASSTIRIGESITPSTRSPGRRKVDALFLDLDGTTLDANSRLSEENADAIEAALLEGIHVVVATGKARPAVLELFEEVGLSSSDSSSAGRVTAVGYDRPGIFLQGIDAFGASGLRITENLPGDPFLDVRTTTTAIEAAMAVTRGGWAKWWESASNGRPMPADVARAVEELEEIAASCSVPGVPLVGFLGDTCVSVGPEAHPEVVDLHERYREPLSKLFDSPEEAIAAAASEAAWKKGLIFAEPELITRVLRPLMDAALEGSPATTMQAIDTMLEVVPRGFNKAVAASAVASQLGIPVERIGAVGDGENDREMLLWAGRPVLVANAAPTLRDALSQRDVLSVSANDQGGVAEAIERLCF